MIENEVEREELKHKTELQRRFPQLEQEKLSELLTREKEHREIWKT